jgi:hypothetical protein
MTVIPLPTAGPSRALRVIPTLYAPLRRRIEAVIDRPVERSCSR